MLRRLRSETGAAAVEFALLFPIFIVMVFGMISGGEAYSRKISITQAAREGSRYGSTLPIPPDAGQTIDDWLKDVLNATIAAGGLDLSATNPVSGQWVCVAYVAPATGGTQTTDSMTKDGSSAPVSAAAPCWDDSASGATQARVQVEVRRSTDWNLLIADPTVITLDSRSVTEFEREIP